MLQLKTKRLLLRDLQQEDWKLILKLSSEHSVRTWQSFLPKDSEPECREWVQNLMFHNCQRARFAYNFSILLQSSDEAIGWIGFGHASDKMIGDRDIVSALLPHHWGRGYMTEALEEVLSLIFSQRDANSVFGECNRSNVGSARVMQKCGMKLVKQWTETDEAQLPREMDRYLIERTDWKIQNEPELGWD